MAFLGLMTVREHEAVVKAKSAPDQLLVQGYIDQLFEIAEQRDAETKRANELAAEVVALKLERDAKPAHHREDIARGDRWRDRAFAQAREMEALRAELATLKVERERRLAPLAAANAARKANAQAARVGDVREGV